MNGLRSSARQWLAAVWVAMFSGAVLAQAQEASKPFEPVSGQAGKDVVWVNYMNGGHGGGVQSAEDFLDMYKRMVEFYDSKLKKAEQKAATSEHMPPARKPFPLLAPHLAVQAVAAAPDKPVHRLTIDRDLQAASSWAQVAQKNGETISGPARMR